MTATRYTLLLPFVLLTTFVINLIFQEQIATAISPSWDVDKALSQNNEIENPLFSIGASYSDKGIELVVPPTAQYFPNNPPTLFPLLALVPLDTLENKVDILVVGDSTLMWGFDHQQLARNSGLRTAQITFGQNIPDGHLSGFIALLSRCIVAPEGIVILSYSRRALLTDYRPSRPVDNDLRNSALLKNCDDLGKAVSGTFTAQQNPLLDSAAYKAQVLDVLVAKTDDWVPLGSARIGWKSFFPDREEADRRKFLVWQHGLKVPWQGNFNVWNYRKLDPDKASADWREEEASLSAEDREIGIKNMQAWSSTTMGRTVCHVFPLTSNDEDYRYGVWRDWTDSRCLLDFGGILNGQVGITTAKVADRHHFYEESGLVMAAAVGKLLSMERQMITDNASSSAVPSRQPEEKVPGVWLR